MKKFPVSLKASDAALEGKYANTMQVLHTEREFIVDFILMLPPSGSLVSRVILAPETMKECIKVLQNNLDKFNSKAKKPDFI